MNNDDKILFEQRFYSTGQYKLNDGQIAFFINLILNSKEFDDTPLKISNRKSKGILNNITFKSLQKSGMYVEFDGSYTISDGINHENRTIEGTIRIQRGEAILYSIINRLGNTTEKVELYEIYSISNNIYHRFSKYPTEHYINKINSYDFEKYSFFLNDTLNKMRKR